MLLQEALSANMFPTSSKRTRVPQTPAADIPQCILSGKELPGERILYRLSQNIDLDYGKNISNDFIKPNRLVPSGYLDALSKCTTVINAIMC